MQPIRSFPASTDLRQRRGGRNPGGRSSRQPDGSATPCSLFTFRNISTNSLLGRPATLPKFQTMRLILWASSPRLARRSPDRRRSVSPSEPPRYRAIAGRPMGAGRTGRECRNLLSGMPLRKHPQGKFADRAHSFGAPRDDRRLRRGGPLGIRRLGKKTPAAFGVCQSPMEITRRTTTSRSQL